MKRLLKVLISLCVIVVLLAVGLQLYLQFGLTETMRTVVLPKVKEDTGLDIKVGELSLNLMKAELSLNQIVVKNPEGYLLENLFSTDRLLLNIDLPTLIKEKVLVINDSTLENAIINIIRNQDGIYNLQQVQEQLATTDEEPPTEQQPEEPEESQEKQTEPTEPTILPELLVKSLNLNTTIRYIDFKLNQLDLSLNIAITGENISTLATPNQEWGKLCITGALGSDKTKFKTYLDIELAPVRDTQKITFDLTGKILEIDPRVLDKIYDKMGLRSAPFGLAPKLSCRDGIFEDSSISLSMREITFEDKLAVHLGGMGSIESLKFPVTVSGTLQEPHIDLQQAFRSAIGGNSKNIAQSFLKGFLAKEAGMDNEPETITDAAVGLLAEEVKEIGKSETAQNIIKDLINQNTTNTNAASSNKTSIVDIIANNVEEISENEATKKLLKDLAGESSSATNTVSTNKTAKTDVIIDVLGEHVDEIGENKEVKNLLKGLGRSLFGD